MDCPSELPELRAADHVVVVWKAERLMGLYASGSLVAKNNEPHCFPIALGDAPAGDKARQGDERTPVGTSRINQKRGMPPRDTALGGDIYLHGGGSVPDDWTDGCVAVSNEHIDLLYAWARPGVAVVIVEDAEAPLSLR